MGGRGDRLFRCMHPFDPISALHDLAVLFDKADDALSVLDASLKLLARRLSLSACSLTLINPEDGQIRIEAAHGMNSRERERGAYAPGEGVTGSVIARGEAMIVADASEEPMFLNRALRRDLERDKISFVCVPIKLHGEAVGALSAEHPAETDRDLNEEARFLAVAASLLSRVAYQNSGRKEQKTIRESETGDSRAIRRVYEQIEAVAHSATTVLLLGESGTGKDLAARAIHAASPRASGPFVSLNCAALPENLIESELFGHEKGAFTGADRLRKGRFELADGGTLFLDEIGELAPLAQAKLLRALQDKAFERLGGMETRRVDIRLIAATNRDLSAMAEAGAFRRDLYYRLNIFPIRMPPLRERTEDILPLAISFLKRFAAQNGKKPPRVSIESMELLQSYSWPGNIRELENCMERASLLVGPENVIFPSLLPAAMREKAESQESSEPLRARLDRLERSCLLDAVKKSGGNMKKAALALGLTERIMGLRAKKHGIDYREFRSP